MISGIIDVLAVVFIVLPIYGKSQGDQFYHVNLLSNTHMPNIDIGIHWAISKSGIEKALEVVGLHKEKRKVFADYSLGMKQRLGIAAAIMHEPELHKRNQSGFR